MRMMIVKGITRRPDSDTAILILSTETADLRLDLVILQEEAVRLCRLFAAVGCRCTPIYESLLILAEHLEASVARAVLDAAGDRIKTTLIFTHQGRELTVECNPGDAIALALRTQTPICATPAALALACPTGLYETPEAPDKMAHWLAQIRPSDFETPPSLEP